MGPPRDRCCAPARSRRDRSIERPRARTCRTTRRPGSSDPPPASGRPCPALRPTPASRWLRHRRSGRPLRQRSRHRRPGRRGIRRSTACGPRTVRRGFLGCGSVPSEAPQPDATPRGHGRASPGRRHREPGFDHRRLRRRQLSDRRVGAKPRRFQPAGRRIGSKPRRFRPAGRRIGSRPRTFRPHPASRPCTRQPGA